MKPCCLRSREKAFSSCDAATGPREQREWIKAYFLREIMPVLTPIGLDPAHPFPRILNKSLNFAVQLAGKDAFGRSSGIALLQAPRVLPRVIKLPPKLAGCDYGFVFLSSIIHAHVGELFSGMEVHGYYQFRVTRNSDLFVDEEEVKNLRTALQGELPQRHFGDAVRLEVADAVPAGDDQFPAAAVRAERRRSVSRERPGKSGATDADPGSGRARRP